ncbi:hypothetical protein SAMN04488543_2849 [Friedmanniella luteola]|uniref:Homeodomain-like domain-containing protein n=1 Tax=Friedmanniella luteola TaxID=546871 RepID=A0A1H1WXL6_9ACTN|nr:hypothetical protein [Friedmanniella luteola]SDT01510.1 hypothetical protein SAMN04488543_2849 [Friedmanniella luteola]
MNDPDAPPRVTDAQLLQLRSWGASHRQIAAMLGLRRNTVSVRLSRLDRNQAQQPDCNSPQRDDRDGEEQAVAGG